MKNKWSIFTCALLCAAFVTACGSEAIDVSSTVESESTEEGVSEAEETEKSEEDTSEAPTEVSEETSSETEEKQLSEIESAYNRAVTLTLYDCDNYDPDPNTFSLGSYCDGMCIIDENDLKYQHEASNHSYKTGALYRSIATMIESFDENGAEDDAFKDFYQDEIPTVFGYTGEQTTEALTPLIDKIRPYYSLESSEGWFLYAIKDLDCVDAKYDVDGEEFDCTIHDTGKLAKEIGLTTKALGYSLGVLAEDGGNVTFSSDGTECRFNSTSSELASQMSVSYIDLESASGLESDEMSRDMSNINSKSSYLIDNDWLYGFGWDNDYAALVKIRTDGTDGTVLRENCYPQNIRVNNGYVYAMIYDYQYGDTYDGSDSIMHNLFRCRTSGCRFRKKRMPAPLRRSGIPVRPA